MDQFRNSKLSMLDPETADHRGEISVLNVCRVLENKRYFPFITAVEPEPRFTPLDGQGVDIVVSLDMSHPFVAILQSPRLYIQVKSKDFHAINFQKHRAEKYSQTSSQSQFLHPLVTLNGQRTELELVCDVYSQLFLFLGLLHDGENISYPNQWEAEIDAVLNLCGEEVRNIVVAYWQAGILRRNRGVSRQVASEHPYFSSRRLSTLQSLALLTSLTSNETEE